MEIIHEAQTVFDKEISALKKMRDALDDTFVEIIKQIVSCKGKVIVTGMGKPKHIAAKIAASFASLGTPSFCLDPASALHGDVGMVSAEDVVIAISYSGASEEIVRIIPIIKMIGAKLIALTGKANSVLAESADIVQIIPDIKEACCLGLAPTSSTTVELCFGDALAVVASKIYAFDETDFGKYHPAGALGKRVLFKVDDIMTIFEGDVPKVLIGEPLIEAITELTKKCMGIVNVIDKNNKLIGIMTDADLRKVIEDRKNIYDMKVDEVMNRSPKVFYQGKLAIDAMLYMKKKKINVMPIVNSEGCLVGCLHTQQLINAGIVI